MNWSTLTCQKVFRSNDLYQTLESIALCGKLLVIAAPFTEEIGVLQGLRAACKACSTTSYVAEIVNPDIDGITDLQQRFAGEDFDAILAIGGGSILDTAKVLAVLLANPDLDALSMLKRGEHPWFFNGIPIVAIPTTAGTGAESTPFATVWDLKHGGKYSLESAYMLPGLVVLDASLTLGLPHEQTLFTGLDALTHATESLWNKACNPMARAYAKEAISLLCGAFLPTLHDPQSLELRQRMLDASNLAGNAIGITKTAIAHAISYPLTYRFAVPHGLAASFTIPALYNYLSAKDLLTDDTEDSIKRASDLVAALNPQRYLGKYLSRADLLSLLPEMNNPQRFGNFIAPVSTQDLAEIVGTASQFMACDL